MEYIRKVDKLVLEGNLSEKWRVFKQNFDVFATAIEIEKKPEPVRIAIFLNAIGSDALETFNSFGLTNEQKTAYVL